MWRRTADSWGYSPLDDIDRRNVARLTLAWSVDLDEAPSQEGIPLVYDGVLYFPSPMDVTTAFDAATGKKLWEHRRALPADLGQFVPFPQTNRNLAIYGRLIIDNGADDFIYALDAVTGEHGLGNQDPRLQDPSREAGLRAARRERRADRGTQLPAERRPRRLHHHGPRRAHGQGALAQAHDPETRRARRRQLGRRARRAALARRRVDDPELRPRARPRLRRHLGHGAGAEVHARRQRQAVPLSQLDARASARDRRDGLVLPARRRSLGSRSSVRAHA